jgi:hypothetical protein
MTSLGVTTVDELFEVLGATFFSIVFKRQSLSHVLNFSFAEPHLDKAV